MSLILFLFGTAFIGSQCTSEKEIIEEKHITDLRYFSTLDFSCLENVEFEFDSVTYDIFNVLEEFTIIGNDIHQSQTAGYYCPCYDCPKFNEFKDEFYTEVTASNYSNLPILDSTMAISCSNWYSLDEINFVCDEDISSLKATMKSRLNFLRNWYYISTDERTLLGDFIDNYFDNAFSVDYCDYISELNSISTVSPSNGLFSSLMILAGPAVMKNRADLLIAWNQGGTISNETAGFYHLYMVGRLWGVMVYNALEKGCSGLNTTAGGQMMINEAGRSIAYGI